MSDIISIRFALACCLALSAGFSSSSLAHSARRGSSSIGTAYAQTNTRLPVGRAAPGTTTAVHAGSYKRLLIRNAMVIYGNGKPAYGPVDILIEDGLITRIGPASGAGDRPRPAGSTAAQPDAVIDATGKYVMPGMVNTHMHWHEERMPGIPMPIQYERNLYLATGTTTAREVGGNYAKSKEWREQSASHRIIAPRMLVYQVPARGRLGTPDELRAGVRAVKESGGDGLKFIGGYDRDQLAAALDEAKTLGLRSTAHIAVEETTARDFVELGIDCIEHFYGVADAALDGVQNFPPDHNASNEVHRFARAGELYIQPNLNRAALSAVLDLMVARRVAWSPTMSTYEASRDLIKNQNLPWYRDYLHPSLEQYYKPSFERHGAFWFGWTNTQEVRWKQNYRVWMDTLRSFGLKGGVITTGDDAGYLYGSLYGFGMVRELELHEEAGFHPLEVIAHATVNGAKVVGLEDRIGRVRLGYLADLLIVNGNPLENLRLLNPYGADVMTVDGRPVPNTTSTFAAGAVVQNARGGGIEWTLKDGIPYHVPTLMKEVRGMVDEARAEIAARVAYVVDPPSFTASSPRVDIAW